MPVGQAIEHLVGMQAQEPQAPYVGLWSRIAGFRPEDLSSMIAGREAVRMGIMRATIHLVSARDCMRLYPLMWPVLERGFRGSPFSKHIAGVDLDDLLATGRELLAAEPRTRAELSPLLAERWPGTDPASLAYAVTFLTPLVQVPPRGLWRQSAQPRLTTAQAWLGRELEEHPSLADAILRYLAAFGPATVKDIQAWCGLTRLAAVVDEIGDHLRVLPTSRATSFWTSSTARCRIPRPPRRRDSSRPSTTRSSRMPTAAGSSGASTATPSTETG